MLGGTDGLKMPESVLETGTGVSQGLSAFLVHIQFFL